MGLVAIENRNELRRFLMPSIIIIRSLIVTMVIVFRQCVVSVFSTAADEDKVLKLFSVSITSISYLAGQFSIVATRYGSIVIAVPTTTATCLLKVKFSS